MKKKWIFLFFFALSLFLFYKPLLLLGCKALLHSALSKIPASKTAYEKIAWEKHAIVLSGLQIKEGDSALSVDRVELAFSHFQPRVTLIHPQILISSYSKTSSLKLPLFYRTRWVKPLWSIENGVIQLPSSARFYFSLTPEAQESGIGQLCVSHDPDPQVLPLLSADIAWSGRAIEVGFKLQEGDLSSLLPLTSLIFPQVQRHWERASGGLELAGSLLLNENLSLEKLHCYGEAKKIALSGQTLALECEELGGTFSYPALEAGGALASIKMKGGAFSFPDAFAVKDLEGRLSCTSQEESELSLYGLFLDKEKQIPFFVAAAGSLERAAGTIDCLLDKERPVHAPFSFYREEKTGGAFHLDLEKTALDRFPLFGTQAELSGHAQCSAALSQRQVEVRVLGDELLVQHPAAELAIPHLEEKGAEFSYDFATKRWSAQIPLPKAHLQISDSSLSACEIQGTACYEGASWSFKGGVDTTPFSLQQCAMRYDTSLHHFSLENAEGKWQFAAEAPFVIRVKRLSADLHGEPAVDFDLKILDDKQELAHLEGQGKRLSSKEWEIVFGSEATQIANIPLNIARCILDEAGKLKAFEMKPTLACQNLHAHAKVLQTAGILSSSFSAAHLQEWELEGTLRTHLFTEDFAKGFSLSLESSDLKVKGKSWNDFHLSVQKIGETWRIEKLKTQGLLLHGLFIVEANGLSFPELEGDWKGIAMKGSGYWRPEQKRLVSHFESVRADLPHLQGHLLLSGQAALDYSDPQDPLQIAGEVNGVLDIDGPLSLTAATGVPLLFAYDKTLGLTCAEVSAKLKAKASGLSLGQLRAERLIRSPNNALSVQKLQFSLTPSVIAQAIDAQIIPAFVKALSWEGNLDGSGDLTYGASGTLFQGSLKPGRYGWGEKSLRFDQLHIRKENEQWSARAKTQVQRQPLFATLQVDTAGAPFGVIKLLDHPHADGLKLLFTTQGGKIIWESAQGSCYGISCQLKKNTAKQTPLASALTGQITVDVTALGALLPQEITQKLQQFPFGSGYSWQGDLLLFQEIARGFEAHGTLYGEEFEAFGYRFAHLEASLEAAPDRLQLFNVRIDDSAGSIAAKEVSLRKREEWELYIPKIDVRNLQPSRLRKVGAPPKELKPFTIQNFTLSEIRGKLGDKESLQGAGRLTFVNSAKKEASLLDIPFEMIKKIGLDPGLLTPIHGEFEIELAGDKFYLVSLKDAYSEGKRSEFYLALGDDLSYIDLDGKMHIDLKMHQDVMLKLTEPFTLTIRGTLEKPRYGFQF